MGNNFVIFVKRFYKKLLGLEKNQWYNHAKLLSGIQFDKIILLYYERHTKRNDCQGMHALVSQTHLAFERETENILVPATPRNKICY